MLFRSSENAGPIDTGLESEQVDTSSYHGTGREVQQQALDRAGDRFAERANRGEFRRKKTWQAKPTRDANQFIRKTIETKTPVRGKPGKGEFKYVENGIQIKGSKTIKTIHGSEPVKASHGLIPPDPPAFKGGMNRKERKKVAFAKKHDMEYSPRLKRQYQRPYDKAEIGRAHV